MNQGQVLLIHHANYRAKEVVTTVKYKHGLTATGIGPQTTLHITRTGEEQ